MKVLYVAGWGRSGTTILDTLLGAHDGVFSAGEVHYLWERGFLEGRTCGCGEPLAQCTLWTKVLQTAYGAQPPAAQHVVDLQNEVARVRHTPSLLLEALRHRPSPGRKELAGVLSQLYRAIGEVTGADLVVDSSKRPSDAAVVAGVAGVEPYLLHMVRDPRAVAFSWMRRTVQPDRPRPAELVRHGAAESTLSWLTWNAASEALGRAYPRGRYLRLRYEDFIADPRAGVRRVLDFVGVPEAGSPFRDDRTAVLPSNHTASGNPSRFRTGEVTLRLDDAWQREQRPADRYLSTAVALPLLAHYGYPLR